MVVLNKKSFKLPYMEKDKFILLLRLGLDRTQNAFYLKNYNNIEKLLDTLSAILKGEEIVFLQSCQICGTDFACSDCKYAASCATRNLPFECICPHCLKEGRVSPEKTTTRPDTLV